jgi:ubiquinone/menaquinone biosynthesis C-methylase UbiE
MDEAQIQQFWNSHPCGDALVGGLNEQYSGDYEEFFTGYDRWRYELEGHIPACIDRLHVDGKQVLEIGPGEGGEAELLIRRGARYSALDLTAAAIDRTTTRLQLRDLPFERIQQGSALAMPFEDNSFDTVFSHGVLHHIPDIKTAQSEIHRVLRPTGELAIMMYSRWSLNYVVAIGGVRRAAVAAAYPFRSKVGHGMLKTHLDNAEKQGLGDYLRLKQFVHANTDGPENPYAKVYDLKRIREDFPDFEITESWREFMHAPPLPIHRLPGGHQLGWHLWVRMRPRQK